MRRDKRCRLGSTARQTCTHAALPQSRMQNLRLTGPKRAHPGMLSVLDDIAPPGGCAGGAGGGPAGPFRILVGPMATEALRLPVGTGATPI